MASNFIFKKDKFGHYKLINDNKKEINILIYLMKEFFANAILNFLKDADIGDSLGLIDDSYSVDLIENDTVSIIYLAYNSDIEKELLRIKKEKLTRILDQWIKVEEKQPSEIIILQTDDDLEIKGIFPLGECPILPYALYRKINNYYSKMTTKKNDIVFHYIYLIFWQFNEDKDIFAFLINFLKQSNKNEFSCKPFKIEVKDEKIILTDTSQTDPYFLPHKEYELKKAFVLKALIDIYNAINKDAQEIIISLNADGSYKVEASFEPIEEFPKYRCYP